MDEPDQRGSAPSATSDVDLVAGAAERRRNWILIALVTFGASYHPNADALTAFAGFIGLGVGILGAWLSVIPIDALRALCEAANTNVDALRSVWQRIGDLEASLAQQSGAAGKDAKDGQAPSV